ncbi:glutamate 5-kinase [bacterium]|nr:glutamate 5-kinase [bacterium]
MREKVQTAVIKVGTSTLMGEGEEIDEDYIAQLAEDIAEVYRRGVKVILVTSGAIRAGLSHLKLSDSFSLPFVQAMAAIGQGILMRMYESAFSRYDLTIGQVLLTHDDLATRDRFLNARNTLLSLLQLGAIPIINENDTVATEEIKFGDNDILAAMVSATISADLLLLLSDVEGLLDEEGKLIPRIDSLTPEILSLAGPAGRWGRGGMKSKLESARIATASGVDVVIAKGREEDVVQRVILNKEPLGTFIPAKKKMQAKKRWLTFISRPKGKLLVNEGAMKAIVEEGKSLLPVGIIGIEGIFKRGDVVRIICEGKEFARGLTNYDSSELRLIMGHHSKEIEKILGYKGYEEVVHRDNLAIIP